MFWLLSRSPKHYCYCYCCCGCDACNQDSGASAEEWASLICSKLGTNSSHSPPRGKHARHADVLQLVRITASSLDSVLNSAQELQILGSRLQQKYG